MTKIHTSYQTVLLLEAAQLRIEAAKVPPGRARDALLQRISRLELAATVEGWVSSPGLRCPKETTIAKALHRSQVENRKTLTGRENGQLRRFSRDGMPLLGRQSPSMMDENEISKEKDI
jgi:hypothetical protein